MELYNRSERRRKVVAELDLLVSTIPAGDDAHITLTYSEFILAKEELGWKTGLFRPWPKYKGITVVSQGFPK
jgi:hypothetical protein